MSLKYIPVQASGKLGVDVDDEEGAFFIIYHLKWMTEDGKIV